MSTRFFNAVVFGLMMTVLPCAASADSFETIYASGALPASVNSLDQLQAWFEKTHSDDAGAACKELAAELGEDFGFVEAIECFFISYLPRATYMCEITCELRSYGS